jgi:Zn-dependent protease with chaperone function
VLLGAALCCWAVIIVALVHIQGWIWTAIDLAIVWGLAGTLDAISPQMIRTEGVRVGPDQLPTIYRAVTQCAERLHLTAVPDVYIIRDTAWNAFATLLARRRVVVLYSTAVDAILPSANVHAQLAFLIGHEFGHHVAGHIDRCLQIAENTFWWCPWLRQWHSRHGEATSDRIGLYCSGDLDASLQVIANMMVGTQLAREVNPEALIQYWQQVKHEKAVLRYISGLEHFPLLCRYAELTEAADALVASGLFIRPQQESPM